MFENNFSDQENLILKDIMIIAIPRVEEKIIRDKESRIYRILEKTFVTFKRQNEDSSAWRTEERKWIWRAS